MENIESNTVYVEAMVLDDCKQTNPENVFKENIVYSEPFNQDTKHGLNITNYPDEHTANPDSAFKESIVYNEPFNHDIKHSINDTNYSDKHSANWTNAATSTLLKLYESKLEMLETPKKKTAMWAAISDSLKDYNIEMTPNQVRWKINALTQKYKQCVDSGQQNTFKYFKELENIYGQCYNDDSVTVTQLIEVKKYDRKNLSVFSVVANPIKKASESRSSIELRKVRLANRIDTDRCQNKFQIEKQWLEYLRRQEEHKLVKDELFDKNLRLREEKLELEKQELEMKETLEYRKLAMKEREQELILQIEKEKCDMLRYIVANKKGRLEN